jgi:hypothetical protein
MILFNAVHGSDKVLMAVLDIFLMIRTMIEPEVPAAFGAMDAAINITIPVFLLICYIIVCKSHDILTQNTA